MPIATRMPGGLDAPHAVQNRRQWVGWFGPVEATARLQCHAWSIHTVWLWRAVVRVNKAQDHAREKRLLVWWCCDEEVMVGGEASCESLGQSRSRCGSNTSSSVWWFWLVLGLCFVTSEPALGFPELRIRQVEAEKRDPQV